MPAYPDGQESISNARRLFELRAGLTVTASAASIAFLWTHWHLLWKLEGGSVRITESNEGAWCGQGHGGKGEWYLRTARYDAYRGRFEFYNWVRFMGIVSRGTSVFEYRRVDGDSISYWGCGWGEMPSLLGLFRAFFENRANRVMVEMNTIGGRAAERISRQPDLVDRLAPPEVARIWEELREDEAAQLRGEDGPFKRFQQLEEPTPEAQRMRMLKEDVRALVSLVGDRRSVAIDEYETALRVFAVDPPSAAAKLRALLERMVGTLFAEKQNRMPTPADSLFNQIEAIRKRVPEHIYNAMHTVRTLGNIGAHSPTGATPSRIDHLEFRTSFDSLVAVTEWYLRAK